MINDIELERIRKRSVLSTNKRCLIWDGSLSQKGYPFVRIRRKTAYVHRALWEHFNGKLKHMQAVGRKCRNKQCVRLSHFYLKKHYNPDPFGDFNRQRTIK